MGNFYSKLFEVMINPTVLLFYTNRFKVQLDPHFSSQVLTFPFLLLFQNTWILFEWENRTADHIRYSEKPPVFWKRFKNFMVPQKSKCLGISFLIFLNEDEEASLCNWNKWRANTNDLILLYWTLIENTFLRFLREYVFNPFSAEC